MPEVWVVDDDESIRLILEESLKSDGLEVKSFARAEDIISNLENRSPDLVISDIKMPGVNGYDLLKHLQNNYEDIPVIIMTAFTDFIFFGFTSTSDKTQKFLTKGMVSLNKTNLKNIFRELASV